MGLVELLEVELAAEEAAEGVESVDLGIIWHEMSLIDTGT